MAGTVEAVYVTLLDKSGSQVGMWLVGHVDADPQPTWEGYMKDVLAAGEPSGATQVELVSSGSALVGYSGQDAPRRAAEADRSEGVRVVFVDFVGRS